MKVGILLSAYDCERYIERCLAPWISLKESMDIVIAAGCGQWLKFKQAGVPPTKDRTFEILTNSNVDFLFKNEGNVLSEEQSRETLLRFLQTQDCDLIWVLDGDEVYSIEEIIRTLDYVSQNPDANVFTIHFKNYVIRYPLYVDWFVKPVIYREGVHGGLNEFEFDTNANYRFRKHSETKHNLIPLRVTFPEHFTWLEDDKRSFEKVIHQEYKFSHLGEEGTRCGFRIEGDKLKFNERYYDRVGQAIPVLSETLVDSKFLRLTFIREEAKLLMYHVSSSMESCSIHGYDQNGNFLFDYYMGLVHPTLQDQHLWIAMSNDVISDLDQIRLDVYDGKEMIHSEKLHIRV